ncbi:MAG: RsmB/NOP family class I SAM-dependent RNA methyltransferase [Candidatus Heimdallarchaeota archaeon]|nr:RsmB/NOP family class I SAM-dependent RNA methyltransferase [Candidatus Heimdallarchaeota archaeon]
MMRDREDHIDAHKLGNEYGYDVYMVDRFIEMMGEEETSKLIQFNETKINKTIRLNPLRSSFEHTTELLERKRIKLQSIEGLPEAREIVESPVPIGATPEYLAGYYMLQGKNSMLPTKILDPKSDELIGDLAAAPGGKTSHLAQLMNNEGVIVALEISSNRCRSLNSNLSRMGVENTIVLQYDSRKVSELELEFDKILLDAPCSGSGVIISDHTRKKSKTMQNIHDYHLYQTKLLTESLGVLRSGGELVYCTCSLEPEENELVITKILEDHDCRIEEIAIKGEKGLLKFQKYAFHPEVRKAKRIYPHTSEGEGFFIIKLVKD